MKFNLKGLAMKAAGTGAGAYAGVKLNKIGFVAKQKPEIRGAIKLALGAVLPSLTKQKPGSIVDCAANGLMAVGALEVASKFDTSMPALAGIGSIPTIGEVQNIVFDEDYGGMNGINDVQAIGADDEEGDSW